MDDLAVDDIITIHSRHIAREGGDARVLSEANLHQLVFQVNLSMDVFHKAALVLFSFCAYPTFREGNMQTALCIIKKIFSEERYRVIFEEAEHSGLVKGVESFSLEIEDVEDWLHRHAEKRPAADQNGRVV
jgi:prophage maintenance system killer protein